MTNLNLRISTVLRAAMLAIVTTAAGAVDTASGTKVKVDDSSFHCIRDMTSVRHFYVDNLLGDVAGTVAVANAGQGNYPAGSVLQLMPNEVMVKHEKGFNPATRDWEFFYIVIALIAAHCGRARCSRTLTATRPASRNTSWAR